MDLCPKPDEDHYVGECSDPTASTIPVPTVRVEMVREPTHEMTSVSSALVFKTEDPAVPKAGK